MKKIITQIFTLFLAVNTSVYSSYYCPELVPDDKHTGNREMFNHYRGGSAGIYDLYYSFYDLKTGKSGCRYQCRKNMGCIEYDGPLVLQGDQLEPVINDGTGWKIVYIKNTVICDPKKNCPFKLKGTVNS